MENIKFSIIIPAYNAQRWISECVKSLINQTYDNFEIIIIDDGSTDLTWNVISKIKSMNEKKIKVFHQNNSGQIESRLKGIEAADSDYCLFVDADDTLELNALEIISSILNSTSVDMLVFNGYRWSASKEKSLFWPEFKENIWIKGMDGVQEVREDAIKSKRFNNIWIKAFKTSILKSASGYKNVEFVRKEEDLLMQLPYFDLIQSVAYIPYELYNYRKNEESITYHYNKDQFKGCCYVSHELNKYGKKWHVSNYQFYCNSRFLCEVIICIKQIGKAYSNVNARNELLEKIANDNYFSEVLKSKEYSLTLKQKILLRSVLNKKFSLVNSLI